MATMNISLPDDMKAWVESQADGSRYANVSDFMRDMIRKAQDRAKYIAWLNAEVEKGYASGFTEGTIDEFFDEALKGALTDEAPK